MSAQYDSGLLNDFGGGNVDWWWDYIRAEVARCNEFHTEQLEAAVAAARAEGMREAAKPQLSAKQQYCLDSLVQHGPSSSWHICARALADGTNKTRCRYEWADAPIRELRAKGLIEKTGAKCGMDRPIYRAVPESSK